LLSVLDDARAASEATVREYYASDGEPPSTIPDAVVDAAIFDVDNSGICERVRGWLDEERRREQQRRRDIGLPPVHGGGAPRRVHLRAVLVGYLLAVRDERPRTHVQVAEVLNRRISSKSRAKLDYPDPPAHTTKKQEAAYQRSASKTVGNRFNEMLSVIDPDPFPKHRRLTPTELAEARAATGLTDAQRALRRARLNWVSAQIHEASIQRLPRQVYEQWDGSVAIDATILLSHWDSYELTDEAKKKRKKNPNTKLRDSDIKLCSADPTAGWYVKQADKRDTAAKRTRQGDYYEFGHLSHKAVMAADDPEDDKLFPNLILNSTVDTPSYRTAENSLRVLEGIVDRGHRTGWMAGDRAYSGLPAEFQNRVRELGYLPIYDYKIDQLGIQDSHHGALQVDGNTYCPALEKALINAEKDYRDKLIDADTRNARIDARQAFQLKRNGKAAPNGSWRAGCPARGPSPSVKCPLYQHPDPTKTIGKPTAHPSDQLKASRQPVCTQQWVTFPASFGAKSRQELPYGTKKWHTHYSTLRNSDEGVHGYAKDPNHENLGEGARRRLRGIAAVEILDAFSDYATNLRNTATFMANAHVDDRGRIVCPRETPESDSGAPGSEARLDTLIT
jgi:hypothetical protein